MEFTGSRQRRDTRLGGRRGRHKIENKRLEAINHRGAGVETWRGTLVYACFIGGDVMNVFYSYLGSAGS